MNLSQEEIDQNSSDQEDAPGEVVEGTNKRLRIAQSSWKRIEVGEVVALVRLPSDPKLYLRDWEVFFHAIIDIVLLLIEAGVALFMLIAMIQSHRETARAATTEIKP